MRASFLKSPLLWDHARFMVSRGSSWLSRDNHLIFHGCVPVDEGGAFLPMTVDGEPRAGRALFDAIDVAVTRALNHREPGDLDLLWYLWSGPLSPMFGKDRITTLERDLIADPALHDACRDFPRQALHARRLAFDHPVTGERVDAVAPIPADVAGLLAAAGLTVPG